MKHPKLSNYVPPEFGEFAQCRDPKVKLFDRNYNLQEYVYQG